MSQSPEHLSSSDEEILENDPVWDLLEQGSTAQANPLFSRNILREIRLTTPTKTTLPFWKKTPALSCFYGSGVVAALSLAISLFPQHSSPNSLSSSERAGTELLTENSVQELLQEELLLAAADHPTLFTDEELVTILF